MNSKPSSEQILEAVDSNPRLQKKVIRTLHQKQDRVRRISRFCGGLQNRLWGKARKLRECALQGYREGVKSTQGDES
jgi:alpha-ketoglutarate-dependent taurine dioxygenase